MRVHSVLYGNELDRIITTVKHLNRAADLAIAAGAAESVTLIYGDSSPHPLFSDEDVARLKSECYAIANIEYHFFDSNLGSALGHNTLLAAAANSLTAGVAVDSVLIMNPDVMLAPDALIELARPLFDTKVAMVEARQLPIEHPKEYNRSTGETGWATTACALIPFAVCQELGGFDNESFFLYCDDVDFSWRARIEGYKIIYQPSATAFHDKRLDKRGRWAPTHSERYYSAEAALLMAHKYSRPGILKDLLKQFADSPEDHIRLAAANFLQRKEEGRLPAPIDPGHKVSVFDGPFYTKHRFEL
ncbi:glycosyltransferase family 2 protein [Luteibacter yeojuensis]|uniref:Glycosyltransferase family 2 protein n=1 Tax=Luteibacter yeojuensis TaxID=345309 RepID=A0A7X5QUV6_9GAMM|nr:glycosyltransferase family 2 protein [Luteibacter yeojuensis]